MSNLFTISFFNNKFENSAREESQTWASLLGIFSKPIIRNDKDGQLISGAIFNGTRLKQNAIESSLLILDFDHANDINLSIWQNMGITFACYTTYSHALNDKCAYRVVIPLSNPIPADKYPFLYQWAFDVTNGLIDKNCKDVCRMHYLPVCPSEREQYFEFHNNDGALLDWQSLIKPYETTQKTVLSPQNDAPAQTNTKNAHKQNERDYSDYVNIAIEDEISNVRNASEGSRNDTLNRAAFALGQLVSATWANVNEADIESSLFDAAISAGLGLAEARATIKSGLDSGKLQPREKLESKYNLVGKPIETPALKRQFIKGCDLMKKEFKPVNFIVDFLIPESSLNLLAAPPKVGKSWLAMDLALGVALGGKALGRFECNQHNVLYLSLDSSNEHKLQIRLKTLEESNNTKIPSNLCFLTEFSQGKGAITELLEIIKKNDFKFVVIDILHNLKESNNTKNNSVYDSDYNFIRNFRIITEETGCAILFVHHTNKGKHDDVLNKISGSNGLSGSVDNTFILTRARASSEGELIGIGRDLLNDDPIPLKWDKERAVWIVVDNKSEPLTVLQQTVLNAVAINFRTAKTIAEYAEKGESQIRNVLSLLTQRGYIKNIKRGEYECTQKLSN